MIKPMNRDSMLLIPADTFYYNIEDLEKIKNFIDLSKAKKIFATGDMSEWILPQCSSRGRSR
jgi:hypothetical protein